MSKQVIATMTFRANVNGFSDLITEGETILDADDPTAREYPDRFEPVKREQARPEVEQATAAPGEKRDVAIGGAVAKGKAKQK